MQTGQTIRSYRILSRIESDDPGELYRAEDLRHKRTVAVRILPEAFTRDREARERCMHDVRSAAALDHPNICTIAEAGDTGDGRVFMALICYDGETIRERVHRGPLSVEMCIAIARQMAEGLAMTHEHGIVHGHLSPNTIMVTGDGVVKMMDFGLPQEGGTWEQAREAGAAKPEYRAPEQLRGDIPDERSDIWTFGLILYEMLTGIMPFRGPHLPGRMATIVAEDLPETGMVRSDVPGSLSHLCKRCLSIDPGLRPQSMSEVQSMLGHWPFEIASGGQRVWNHIRGRTIAAGVGALIVIAGLIILILSR
jgi:serine/threonine protein kinase